MTLLDVLVTLVQGACLYLAGSVFGDGVHYLLHRCMDSRWAVLRLVGEGHAVHHRFYDEELRFQEAYLWPNLLSHVLGELLVQVAALLALLAVFPWPPVVLALGYLVATRVLVFFWRGRDPNHVAWERVPAPLYGLIVGPAYHALHHRWPQRFFSSQVTLFDGLFGTGCELKGRVVAMTGASGALGAPLKRLLEREGARVLPLAYGVDWELGHHDGERVRAALAEADLLVLAHGAKGPTARAANCDSFVAFIEAFLAMHRTARFPPEVWAVGSEIEAHPAFGNPELVRYLESKRAFARHAWRYYWDGRLLYRHIVPSAYSSPMGPGLLSGGTVAWLALFLIKRGYRYVAVTYTGVAFYNYLKFLVRWRPWGERAGQVA